ncbi:MAG TPA: cupredoxin domain-containing protein [Candidatus Thermoplasmatota archaeon]|nr:cupredoxin domain-containing protein [Candidatus Thermoplasmatota archaeon]
MKSLLVLLALALVPLAPGAIAADHGDEPQEAWMLHVDNSDGALRFVPDRIVLVPGGTVQLMIFGQGHGLYSVTLDGMPEYEAEVDTAGAGIVHVAEFAAPTTPGEYPFHDKHHPEAKGLLIVKAPSATSGAQASDAQPANAQDASERPTVGVGNGYDTRFYPERLEVRAGETILFTNNASEIIHTMTAVDGSFDADAVRAGEERTLTAPATPGEYAFICKYHEGTGMRGVLVVLPASPDAASPQPTTPPTASPMESAEEPTRETPGAPPALLLAALGVAALALRRVR